MKTEDHMLYIKNASEYYKSIFIEKLINIDVNLIIFKYVYKSSF